MSLRAAQRIGILCRKTISVATPTFLRLHNTRCDYARSDFCNVNFLSFSSILGRRQFHTTTVNAHGEYEWKDPESEADVVMVTVYNKDGKEDRVRGKVGDNLLYLCKRFDVDMEGACEASLACTTCHVYVDHEFLDLLPIATETEEDLLDQAPFLKDNSRLGCQIILTKEYEGMVLRLPAATKNFYVDGHKPSHH